HELDATPPPCSPENDGCSDAELLRAIGANQQCARILAEIAAGGDARELLRQFLGPAPDVGASDDEPAVAMYQSPSLAAGQGDDEGSEPAFLANMRPDFWDGFLL
ncbi:MAG: hypothetical protein K2J38_05290, partial [Muribaculaceae bacterium]|nr:hypothetical protein [Muribaculaceae bacterium]